MDTVAVDLSRPDADTMPHLINQVLDGRDAVVVGVDGGASFLRAAAVLLQDRRCRVIPVYAAGPGKFTLSGLLSQITGTPDLDVQDDETLERGFQALTVPDPGCDRIVLVVDGADCLQESAFRYLAFTCKASTELQLVLAGRTDPTARLGEGAAFLRARLTECPAFRIGPAAARQPERRRLVTIAAGPVTHGAVEVEDMPDRQPGPANGKRKAVWIVAGLGMAASVVLGFGLGWQARSGSHTGTAAPAASTRTEPADPPGHASTAPLPGSGSVAPGIAAALPPRAAAPAVALPADVGPAHSQASPAEPGLDPLSIGAPDVPPGLQPSPAAPTVSAPPSSTAATPGPDKQDAPAEPGPPLAPPASVPSAAVILAVPPRPAAPPASARDTGQTRQQQATSPSSHPRNVGSSASRTSPPLDVEASRPRNRSEPPSGRRVQAVPPLGANPPASQPAIGSFTVGPDGVRVFHPNP